MSRPALVPELYVSDLRVSLEFYVNVLAFRIDYERPEEHFASLNLGRAHIMLEEAPSLARSTAEEFGRGQWRTADLERPFGRGLNLEIEIDDIEAANDRIAAHDYPLLLEVHEKVYELKAGRRVARRLLLADPDGYLIRLSQIVTDQPGA
jgi:catechol 2,3-dioxygenase-like lactoylglutathione lyase family enzyme